MQQITIRNLGTGGEAAARIIGQMGGKPDAYIYGVALLDSSADLWRMNFPKLSDQERAVFRLVLECNACQERELLYLDELESEVFEANRNLTRLCRRCKEATVWQLAPHEVPVARHEERSASAKEQAAPRVKPRRNKNDRKHIRVQMRMTVCIRQPGFVDEELVEVENVSRGGLSFLSSNTYFAGSTLEIAAPYSAGAANVFIPSRVLRVLETADKKIKRYGVEYIRGSMPPTEPTT